MNNRSVSIFNKLSSLKGLKWLISAHYSAPISFNSRQINLLNNRISNEPWVTDKGNWKFLDSLDKFLLEKGVVPADPLDLFKD